MAENAEGGMFSAQISKETPVGRQSLPLIRGGGKEVEVTITGVEKGEEHSFTVSADLLWGLLKATTKQGNVWTESYSEDRRSTHHWIEDPHSLYTLGTSILRHPPGEGRQHREGSTPE